ncbi:MAG: hypothetical protein ACQESF_07070, partial [Nanobdellota archaeon]
MDTKIGVELNLGYCEKNFKIDYNPEDFDKELIYYLIHPNDKTRLLRTFVLVDFKEGKKKYYYLFSPQNIKKLSGIVPDRFNKDAIEPHHALRVTENDIFLFMYKNVNFIYHLDLKKMTARIINLEDLGLKELIQLGDTFFIDSGSIYISGLIPYEDKWKTKLYKTNLQLRNIDECGEYMVSSPRAPHTTLHHKGILMNVHMLDSKIFVYDIENKHTTIYHTSGSVAGHIEKSGDVIYVSNHNFKRNKEGNGLVFLDPAYIDKFEINNKKLVHKGVFKDNRGFRFTSHKILEYNGKKYIVTVGQPNRLFIVDAEDMSLKHYDIIGKDIFPKGVDPKKYLNENQNKIKDMIRPVEITENGANIILISNSYIVIYSFIKKRIIQIIKAKDDIQLYDN